MQVLWLALRDPSNPLAGGAERSIREIGRRLVERGHKVTAFTGSFRGAARRDRIDGIDVIRSGRYLAPHLLYPAISPIHARFDVTIEDLGHVIPWFSGLAKTRARTAYFRHLHARTLPGQVSRLAVVPLIEVERAYRLTLRNVPFVTESFQSVSDLEALGISRTMITRIPPGVDASTASPNSRAEYPLLVYFGGLRAYKRPTHAVRAFARVVRYLPEARLILIGQGPESGRVSQTVSELGLTNQVHITGRIDSAKIRNILERAWVNIHCSLAEGWGYSIMEASAAGVPTAAYSVPGVREVVREGRNGKLASSGSVEGLSDVILELVSDFALYTSRSRELALEFSWAACAAKWENHLLALCGENSRSTLTTHPFSPTPRDAVLN